MYISNISIHNYRGFQDISINFKDGINIFIGSNNTGKSNLLKALALIFDGKCKKQLTTADFNNRIPLDSLKEHSPKIVITALLSQSVDEDLMGDELVTVSKWLIKLEQPYSAQIQYEFFLPEEYELRYQSLIQSVHSESEAWLLIENQFIRLYMYKIWVGNPENRIQVASEDLSKFDFQFLDAVRDVERDMISGKNTLLRNVIDFFLDYDIKSNQAYSKEQQTKEISIRKQSFRTNADKLIDILKKRLMTGKDEILSYANHVGASFDHSKPTFEGTLNENEVYSILQLLVQQETGMTIPISNNGLGYNNLIFMSLLLAKMQVDSDGNYLGSNAKVFPILAIEEPEAHLHPTMQFQFLKFLNDNLKSRKVRQVFITSHSTHIAASSQLDNLICLYRAQCDVKVSYPGKVFSAISSDASKSKAADSKKYVQRFLDATKSNMLFSEKIILVEGIAEQLLFPVFADYLGKNLEDHHVSIINIDGRYFQHFLYLFDSTKPNTINRKVACVTDIDPMRRRHSTDNTSHRFSACYPYEYNMDLSTYSYAQNTFLDLYHESSHPNIRSFTQDKKFGKTLEYQIAFENPTCKLLLTPSLSNRDELNRLMDAYIFHKTVEETLQLLSNTDENQRISNALKQELSAEWTEEIKKKSIIASRYLNSVGKGENALELSSALQDCYIKDPDTAIRNFHVPEYIKNAINWVCED